MAAPGRAEFHRHPEGATTGKREGERAPVTIESLPPATPRPVQWRRLREQLAILRVADPAKVLDAAYSTGDAIGGMSEERLVRRFLACSEGQRLLAQRPSLVEALADRDALAALPERSLGHAFRSFSARHQIDPRALIASHHAMSRDHAQLDAVRQWIRDRLTAMHDLWHVIAGYDATNAGESALMCFSLAQRINDRALPLFITMSLLTGRISARNVWESVARGRSTTYLPVAPFEELLPLPLDEVRIKLGVSAPELAHPGPNSEGMLSAPPT